MNYFKLYNNAEELYINKEYSLSLEKFLEAYTINPSNTNANYIACCYIALKQYKKAERLLTRLTRTSFWETPWFNLGRLYTLQGMYEDALECLEEALLINPENDDCYFYLGLYYEKIEAYTKAITCYTKAIDYCAFDEDKSVYNNNIAKCYCIMNEYDKAIGHVNNALELDSQNDDAKYNKDLILEKLKLEISNE